MPINVNKIEPDEKIVEIEMEHLREFRNHPFKVKADGQMLQLIEIISGHRRKYAAQNLGFRKVPVIIRVLRDDDAVISMVDSNLFRETIRPSEKAFAYKMKYEAIKRKSGRKNNVQIPASVIMDRSGSTVRILMSVR
ncbi:MAG: ParB N-terminal domain-containing protein [Lachnospiraceae bacterium]|nr:ParB N-terminal domain-containing protein [Lachnospiraceae bacterium]